MKAVRNPPGKEGVMSKDEWQEPWPWEVETIKQSTEELNRLRAENAKLKADYERLRGKVEALLQHCPAGCYCSPEYRDRGIRDPKCDYCDMQPELDSLKQVLEDTDG